MIKKVLIQAGVASTQSYKPQSLKQLKPLYPHCVFLFDMVFKHSIGIYQFKYSGLYDCALGTPACFSTFLQ